MILWTAVLYCVARFEVTLFSRSLKNNGVPPSPDELPAYLVPSVAPSVRLGNTQDRVLAQIDQNGHRFAVNPIDRSLFNTGTAMQPRRHTELLIVLTGGRVRLRKRSLPKPAGDLSARLRHRLAWEFCLEAAALLRLRGFSGAPTLRRIDPRTRTIEMDYIHGHDIRREIAGATPAHSCEHIHRLFLDRLRTNDDPLASDVRSLIGGIMKRGVFPADVHAANFLRGAATGRLYLVDYQLVYFRPVPGWRSRRRALMAWLERRSDAAAV